MRIKIYFFVFLISLLLSGFVLFTRGSFLGFSILNSSSNYSLDGFYFWFGIFILSVAMVLKEAGKMVVYARDRRGLENMLSLPSEKDVTDEREKLFEVRSGKARIYAATLPPYYGGLKIKEEHIAGHGPTVKLWMESTKKGDRIDPDDVDHVFRMIFEAVRKYGKTVIAPTANTALAKKLRTLHYAGVQIQEHSGREMSPGLFRYLVDDLKKKEELGYHHPPIPRQKEEMRYFVITPVS